MPKLSINDCHVSDAVRRLNPELFGPHPSMGRLPAPKPQQDSLRPLVRKDEGKEARPKSLGRRSRPRTKHGPVVFVSLVAFRRTGRELDRDNLIGGFKWLRDAIADWIGLDDSDRIIEWSYSQHHTRGREGVGVKIETTPGPS